MNYRNLFAFTILLLTFMANKVEASTNNNLDEESNELLKSSKKFSLNNASLQDSIFSYKQANSSEYNFSYMDTDSYGNEKEQYYKIVLYPENFSTSKKIEFSDANDGDIKIVLPNEDVVSFNYQYIGDSALGSDYIGKVKTSAEDPIHIVGGALINSDEIQVIDSNFVNNTVSSSVVVSDNNARSHVLGGAVFNDANVGSIIGDFVANQAIIETDTTFNNVDIWSYGGALFNEADIENISGNYIGNHVDATATGAGVEAWASSGAIYNWNGHIKNIRSNFIGNYAKATGYEADARGYNGALYNDGQIDNILGNFIGNYVSVSAQGTDVDAYALGAAIENRGYLGNVVGDFIGNYVVAEVDNNDVKAKSFVSGGAIYNEGNIASVTGNFIGNYVEGKNEIVGGAIFTLGSNDDPDNQTLIGSISGNFIDNHAKASGENGVALGGAIFVDGGEIGFTADGVVNRFSGNYVEDANGNKINNAIYVNNYEGNGSSALNFTVKNGGYIVFDDEIDGGHYELDKNQLTGPVSDGYAYDINISGDATTQGLANSVVFNNKVKNVNDLTLDTAQLVLGKNAHVEIVNDYIAKNNPYLHVEVDAVNGETGQLEIGGQVIGTTKVVLDFINYKNIQDETDLSFVVAPNDTTGNEKSFDVFRVIGNPYMWDVKYNSDDKTWGVVSGANGDMSEVTSEVVANIALPSAGLMQKSGMYNNLVKNATSSLKGPIENNLWVDTSYTGVNYESPVEVDAKIWGIEAGYNLQQDTNNKLGFFVSYRQGQYEMNGKGEKYYSEVTSELEIDSYLAGLYYHYDKDQIHVFASVYGGMQNAKMTTSDGVSSDTDGIEFGADLEAGYEFRIARNVFITPSMGLHYNQISYDDTNDNYRKSYEYGNVGQLELDIGVKIAKKTWWYDGFYDIYVKPSIVQTLNIGGEVEITNLGSVDALENKTLGRVEVGGTYGFNENISAYGWANYTAGSGYNAASVGVGLGISW